MKRVCNDHAPVIITRKEIAPAVLISLEDYQALEETLYLLRSPANTRRAIGFHWRVGILQMRRAIMDREN